MNKNFPRVVLTALFCFVVNYFLIWPIADPVFLDFGGQWKLCAYTLRGIDPYPLVGLRPPLIEEIGIIPAGWSTTPWGLLLGNFFYPGFLQLLDATTYFVLLNIMFLLWTALFVARNLKFGFGKWQIFFVTVTAFFGHFFIATYYGNAGMMICCLLIVCCVKVDERPILSGIFLALAMVKPQVALPICFALLLRKNFKVLTVAAVVDFAAWGIAALMTNQTPLNLLTEFFSLNASGGEAFLGLFTIVFLENKTLTMATSMAAGILFIWWLWRRGFKDEKIFWLVPACLATTFFGYSFHNEFFILLLPALLCLNFAVRADFVREKIFWLTAFVFLAMGHYAILSLLRIIVGSEIPAFWVTRTILAMAIILLGSAMAKKIPTRVRI